MFRKKKKKQKKNSYDPYLMERIQPQGGVTFADSRYAVSYTHLAYEELVAEMTSCFLSADLQVEQTQEHIDNHKAYVQSWIQMIEDKPENLVKAIAQAEKASQSVSYTHLDVYKRQ